MTRHTHIETVRTIDLEHEQLLVLDDRQGTRARVLFGGAWLTEEGRPDDRFARAGDDLELTERGRAVLESIGHSRVEIVHRHSRPVLRWGRRLAAWLLGPRPRLVHASAALVSLALALAVPELVARSFQHTAGSTSVTHAVVTLVKGRAG